MNPRPLLAFAAVALALGSAGFSSTALFEEPASVGGGAGLPYTGSPTAHGLSCASCHQGAVRSDNVDLWSVPEGLFESGYVSGTTYTIHLRLSQEHRGLDRNGACPPHAGGCNRNGFVAEFLAAPGGTMGALCTDQGSWDETGSCLDPAGPTTALMAQKTAISGHSLAQPQVCSPSVVGDCVDVAAMQAAGASQAEIDAALVATVRGRTAWSFQWRAPLATESAAPSGTFYLGVVDGDGGISVDPAHNDYFGDEVVLLQRDVYPVGHPPAAVATGCTAAPGRSRSAPAWPALLLGPALRALLRRRRSHRPQTAWASAALLALALLPTPARAADTSCDIKTGASCLWGEGCDCDHDGYVRDTGKAKKYCHFSKCPIDSNDNDPKQLGKPSADNADGDGWTKSYDCDDNDPCVGQTCGVSTCAVVVDADQDGVPEGEDCNDQDANVYPGAPIACCNCTILKDAAQSAAFGCSGGCPLSNPPPDAGGTDAGSADAGSTDTATQPDTASQPDTATDLGAGETGSGGGGGDSTVGGGLALDVAADAQVGGGVLDLPSPPAPGCSATPGTPNSPGSWALIAAVVLGLGLLRARRGWALAALLALVAGSGGCATVKPWQREKLAHRCMVFGANGGELTNEQHAFQYREGAAGGFGGGGGGCGCN